MATSHAGTTDEALAAGGGTASSPTGSRALARAIGASGVDGIPADYHDGSQWFGNGIKRHGRAIVAAAICSWTGVWLALWGAAIGALLGILLALNVFSSPSLSSALNLGIGGTVTPLGILAGIFLGAIGGFIGVFKWVIVNAPFQTLVAIGSGLILARILVTAIAAYERLGLRLRGYRRLSRDEVRRIAPLVKEIADGMSLDGLPRFAMADLVVPNAWTHMRTIVLTTGALQTLDDGELRAILAHELHHWRSGDSVGLHTVWCAAWPIALTYNLGMLLVRGPSQSSGKAVSVRIRDPLLALIGWAVAWPAWVMLKLVIVPLVAATQRSYEYGADAAAADLGYAPQLISALRKLGAFEAGRTGWEDAMAATHPPTELRIEALQEPQPDDAEYQEDELHGPTRAEVKRLIGHIFAGRGSTPSEPVAQQD